MVKKHITSFIILTMTIVQSVEPKKIERALDRCSKFHWTIDVFEKKSCLKDVHYLFNDVRDWKFAKEQLTLQEFPIDPQKQNYVRQVKTAIFSQVDPTPFNTSVKLAAYSAEVLEELLDMDEEITTSADFLAVVSGNTILPGSTPLAHRYGGHQFGNWADQLGDGRAHLLGEYVSQAGIRWELQFKGSGMTPYSRRGDGRAVIRSSVREFLASEAMYYLGIPTSRAATLMVSRDHIVRDQFYTGNIQRERCAIVLRVAQSWFRYGSLEILTENREFDLLKKLTDFVIKQYFPMVDIMDPDRYLVLYSEIVSNTAEMIAQWQAVGFAHGVCNTDNFSLLSITIDYGPFRFMDEFNPDMVPNSSDDEGRYSFQRQPEVGHYNLQKLLRAMAPLLSSTQRHQMDMILKGYNAQFKSAWIKIHTQKLGIMQCELAATATIITEFLQMMAVTRADFAMAFRQLGDWTHSDISSGHVPKQLWALHRVAQHRHFADWAQKYYTCVNLSKQNEKDRRGAMHKINPRYVLRNWIAQEAIAAVEKDDFSIIEFVHNILKNPYKENEQAELAGYADPPPQWAKQIRVSCSS